MMLSELQNKYQEFQSKQSTMSEAVRIQSQRNSGFANQHRQFSATCSARHCQEKGRSLRPYFQKAEGAIKEVATEGKYSYIFDTSVGAVLHSNDSDNIMDAVKKKLGITAETPKKDPAKNKRPNNRLERHEKSCLFCSAFAFILKSS